MSELSGITPVNTIDPFNGRSTVNSRLVYGTLADTVPTVVEGGRLAQEPIYIAFSALDNLIAFERYEPHVRRRYIAAARNNRVVIGASQIGIQPQY